MADGKYRSPSCQSSRLIAMAAVSTVTRRETALRGRSRCNYDWSQGDVWEAERHCLNLWLQCGRALRWEQRGGSRSCWVTLTMWLFACCSFRFCSSSVAHITAVQLCSAMLRVCFSAPDISLKRNVHFWNCWRSQFWISTLFFFLFSVSFHLT